MNEERKVLLEEVEVLNKKKFNFLNFFAPFIILAVIYLLLEIVIRVANIPRLVLPTPTAIIVETIKDFAHIWPHLLISLRTIILGFLISIPLGMLLAAIFSQFKILVQATTPLLIFIIVTPMISLIPLLILWLGIVTNIRLYVVILQATPIIALNTLVGFTTIESEKLELMKSMGASKIGTFVKVIFPNALPQIFTGIKLGGIFSIIGAISADVVAQNEGLGNRIMIYASLLSIEQVYGIIIIIGLLGITLFNSITLIQSKVVVWKK